MFCKNGRHSILERISIAVILIVFNFGVDLLTFFARSTQKIFHLLGLCPRDFHTYKHSCKLGYCRWNTLSSILALKHNIISNLLRHQPLGRFLSENPVSFTIVLSNDPVANFLNYCPIPFLNTLQNSV